MAPGARRCTSRACWSARSSARRRSGRWYSAGDAELIAAERREHDDLGLLRRYAGEGQRSRAVRNQHQVALAAVAADPAAHLAHLRLGVLVPAEEVAQRCPGRGLAAEREARGLMAAAPRARQDFAHRHFARAQRFAELLRFRPPRLRQIALGAAVLEPETRRVADARR